MERRHTAWPPTLGCGVAPAWWPYFGPNEVRLGFPSSHLPGSETPEMLFLWDPAAPCLPVHHGGTTADLGLSFPCPFCLGFS